ncbi:MAG TPA: PAS domain S-box protein [Spirochaetota bacterium]|nr:PAS domain S-box protein [Spirochaetota bacterium]
MGGFWLTDNIDVILFMHAVTMLLFAGILYRPGHGFRFSNPEFNLQLFALGISLNQWIAIIIYLFPGKNYLYLPGIIIVSISFLALFFYSLAAFPQWLRKTAVFYVIVAAAAAFFISATSGYRMGYSFIYYTLAFPISLGTSFTLFRYGWKSADIKKTGWFIAALSFFLYAVSWFITTPFEFCLASLTGNSGGSLYPCYVATFQTVSAMGILAGFYILKNFNKDGKRYLQERYIFPLLMLSVFILSCYFVSWRSEIAGGEIKNRILSHARAVANAVNPEIVTRLRFSSLDRSNPAFILIRNQMISFGRYSGVDFLYSFTLKDGKLVFGPENIDENDSMASPPGTVYLKPHPDFKKVFNEALPGVIGPYKDEYGTFISGYAPVIDPRSGAVLLVTAIDYPADRWWRAISVVRINVLVTAFIIISAIMFMNILLVMRRLIWNKSNLFAVRQLETFFILGSGILLSLFIFFLFNDSERRRNINNFIPIADSVAGVIRENLFNIGYDLENLSKLFESSEYVTGDEFRIYVHEMRFNPVKARAWYPRIRGSGKKGDSYLLLYEESSIFKKREVYSLSSSSEGKSTINNSLNTGMAAFFRYTGEDGNKAGKFMTVIRPVYKNERELRGFVSSISDLGLLLDYSMSFSRSRNLKLEAEIIDITLPGEEISLARNSSNDGAGVEIFYESIFNEVYPVFICDRVLGIRINPCEGYYKDHIGNTGIMGGVSTLMLAIAVAILSGYLRRREYTLEDEVQARTKELSESRERFRALHEASFGGISIHNKGIMLECNEGLARMTGYTVDELNGMDGLLLIEPSWRDFVMDKILSGYEKSYDVEGIRKDGSVYPLEIQGKNIPYHGTMVRVTEFRDITERKRNEELLKNQRVELERANEQLQAEMEEFEAMNGELIDMNQQLVESEDKFSKAFSINPSIMMISSLEDGNIFEVNSAFLQTFGYEKEDVAGKSIFELDLFVDIGQRDLALDFIRKDGLVRNMEVEVKTSNGERRYGLFSADYIVIHDVKYMLTVMIDITERKQNEISLSHMQKMDAIGQLAGGVAHDFNNHLSGILGYAEILSMKLKDNSLKKYSDGIISVAMRSADLIKKLLAFARKGQFQLMNVDMHHIIDETIEILKHSIDRRITIVKKYNSEETLVSGDPSQLQNVLLNIGLNARDAMPAGGKLFFETREVVFNKDMPRVQLMDILEGDYISISVTDTGIGMDEEVKSHLFEPFFTTKESGKGTGMGLASVYGTIKNHNGSVSVYSEPGEGTTFRIYLPVLKGYNEKRKKTVSLDVPDIPPQRVLIIDDEDVVRGVLSEMLDGMGHSVYEASNGAEGVALYKENWREIDIVIVDMIMPRMNGRDAFLEMKKVNPDIRAILSSGFSLDEESQSMLTEGVMGFIHKPYRTDELMEKMAEIIK